MEFSEFAIALSTLEKTASRITITQLLADLFKRAPTTDIGMICYLLTGRVVPLYEAVEFGMAEKLMIRAIALACGHSEEVVLRLYKKTGDLGEATEQLKQIVSQRSSLSVKTVYTTLYELAQTSGSGSQDKKINLLKDLLAAADPLSARYIVRIPLDKLRLGFSEVTMLDAFSWMLTGGKSLRGKLEEAYNVRPDIGYVATTLKTHGLAGLGHVKAQVGAPILAALCQRLPTADEMIAKMGTVSVEPKYDGVRVQIHFKRHAKGGGPPEVKTFSRNLENTTEMFTELTQMGKQLTADEVILDSEAVGIDPKTGNIIPFQDTMTRKRKHGIAEARTTVPLNFFVFDILYRNQTDLLATPLSERRKILEKTIKAGPILVISPSMTTTDPNEIRSFHDAQLKKGLEGVVVKKWQSPYEPGRRGFSWVKFKEEEGKTGKLTDTIDAVIMGYYRGKGKRVSFGIGAFLVGVLKHDTFVSVTKIGTGVSDALWRELEKKLHRLRRADKPKEYGEINKNLEPDVWVTPQVVVELAGDDLTMSPLHGAGVAVRFPRLVRVRSDKGPQNITTVAEIQAMYNGQKTKK